MGKGFSLKSSQRVNNNENEIKKDNISKSSILMDNYVNAKELKKSKNLEELEIKRKLSEEFITRFVINYCDMIITVIGILKHSTQIMLNKIMEECIKYKKNNLYVIHNLKEFEEKEQVIDYIKNILMKSGTFDLEKK